MDVGTWSVRADTHGGLVANKRPGAVSGAPVTPSLGGLRTPEGSRWHDLCAVCHVCSQGNAGSVSCQHRPPALSHRLCVPTRSCAYTSFSSAEEPTCRWAAISCENFAVSTFICVMRSDDHMALWCRKSPSFERPLLA